MIWISSKRTSQLQRCPRRAFFVMPAGSITTKMVKCGQIGARTLFVIMGTCIGQRPFVLSRAWIYGSAQGYFTTHLEGIRKDVECTFGILKKRWRILNNGFFYRQVKVCEKIFVTCCWLHNFLLDLMDRTNINLGRGAPIGNDGLWLSGPSDSEPPADEGKNDRILSEQFSHRRAQLVHHLHLFRRIGAIE